MILYVVKLLKSRNTTPRQNFTEIPTYICQKKHVLGLLIEMLLVVAKHLKECKPKCLSVTKWVNELGHSYPQSIGSIVNK